MKSNIGDSVEGMAVPTQNIQDEDCGRKFVGRGAGRFKPPGVFS